ncbi:MAG TPA: hypothetical protein VF172_12150 [Nitrososphaera sp.]|jgi:hypothetical protein
MSQQQEQGFLQQSQQSEPLSKPVRGLFELVDCILDKILAVDVHVCATVIGIPLVFMRARIVVADPNTFIPYQDPAGLKGEIGERTWQRISQPHQQQQIPAQQVQQDYGGCLQQGYSMVS